MIAEHAPILVILVYLLATLLMPLAGAVGRRLPWILAVLSSGLATTLSLSTLVRVLREGTMRYEVAGWEAPVGIELVADPLSAFVAVVLSVMATAVLVHSRDPVRAQIGDGSVAYYAAAMLLLCGLSGIVGTGDLFNLYVFLEISSLASYALLGAGSARAAVSAFRYLILGTIGASFYLLGLGFILVDTGSLNMADVAAILEATGLNGLTTVGVLLMLVGMGIKMALLPLHQWLPDAYTTAPATSSALIAPIGTKVAAYVLIRLLFGVFPAGAVAELQLLDVLAALGAGGIIWGSVMAIAQDNLKRMLAYSSVAQLGYIALGLGLGTAYGFIGAVLHILNHAFMKGGLFLVSANLEMSGRPVAISSLDSSVRREMPVTAASFAVCAISMIGLPPTAGFFSKWYLLLGSYHESRWIFVGVIVASSLLNAVYFFRILERMYLGDAPAAKREGAPRSPGLLATPAAALALGLFVLGLGSALLVTHVITPMLPFSP